MSHFTVLIIGKNAEEQLKPFDEQLETGPYVSYTKAELIEKQLADIERYKNSMYAEYISDPVKYANKCKDNKRHLKYISEEFPKKLNWTQEELYAEAIKHYEPEDIGSEGEVYSESNPNGKWDWYSLGGRWAGSFKVNKTAKVPPLNFSWGWNEKDKKEALEENRADCAQKRDILNLDEVITYAVIKDGKWYEKGEMGWWGICLNEKDENKWEREFKDLIAGLPEDTILSVYDCHV